MRSEQLRIGSLLDELQVAASRQHLRVRDHVVAVVTESHEAAALMADTFFPSGMFGLTDSMTNCRPDLEIIDRVFDREAIEGLISVVAEDAVLGRDYELTRRFRLPRFDTDGGTVFVLKDAKSDEPAAVLRKGRTVAIARTRSRLGDRWMTRIVRDVATRLATANGSLILHSSAFVYNGSAYLVVGDSGAGKSTTAIAMARLLPVSGWMGNDRMHLDRELERYRVTACPLPLAINKGTLDILGVRDLGDWAPRAGFPHPDSDWAQFMGDEKLKLSSREVQSYLDVDVVAAATLAGIILPTVDPTTSYRANTADPDDAKSVIRRNCLSHDDNLYGEDWLGVSVDERIAPSLEGFLEHAVRLPILSCSVGQPSDASRLAADFLEFVG